MSDFHYFVSPSSSLGLKEHPNKGDTMLLKRIMSSLQYA